MTSSERRLSSTATRRPYVGRAAGMLLAFLAAASTASGGITYGWLLKMAVTGLGNPLARNGQNPNTLYSAGMSGGDGSVIVSRDRGEMWETLAVVSGGANVKQVIPDPADSLTLLAAQETNPLDRIMKSTDGGSSWTQTFSGDFSYFGVPVEFSPTHPDTLYTMSGTILFHSTDFGSTWDTVNAATGFNAWCDAALRPDSGNILYVGDATNGIWKTTDGGLSFRRVYETTGEIPMIAIDPANPAVAYATHYAGGGGLLRSSDYGESWQQVPEFSGINTWGVAYAPGEPQVILMGVFEPGNPSLGTFLSPDGGVSWRPIACGLSSSTNYGLMVLDTATALVLQSDGLYALTMVDSAALPRGAIAGVVEDALGPRQAAVHLAMRSCSWTLELSQETDSIGRFAFPDLLPVVPPFVTGYDVDIDPELPYAHLRIPGVVVDSGTTQLTAPLAQAEVFVAGEDSADYLAYYRAALDAKGIGYNAWNTVTRGPAPVTRAAELGKRTLVYFTGTSSAPLDSGTLSGLAAALDSGIHLFLNGQNLVEQNAAAPLFHDLLGVSWAGNILLTFVNGSELCEGLAFYTSVGEGAHNQTSRDVLAAPGWRTVMEYSDGVNSYPAAVRRDSTGGGSRVVVAGFGFESIAGAGVRAALMGQIVGYLDGSIVVGTEAGDRPLPSAFTLEQNFPNPFNPSTKISFTLPVGGLADLRVVDLLGREVALLLHETLPPGTYEHEWQAPGIAGGLYFVQLTVGPFAAVRKMLLLR